MALEGELGVVFFLLLLRADLAFFLAIDLEFLEDLVRATHVVDAAEADGLILTLGAELQLGVALELKLRDLDAELLHEQAHDVVDASEDVEGLRAHWCLL
jgi:hypothetical protein